MMVRMKEEQFDDVIRINLKGAYNMLQLCGAMMMRAKQGRIINISSISGMVGNFGQINYCAAKAGLLGMTKTAAKELGPRGITVNAGRSGLYRHGYDRKPVGRPQGRCEKADRARPLRQARGDRFCGFPSLRRTMQALSRDRPLSRTAA